MFLLLVKVLCCSWKETFWKQIIHGVHNITSLFPPLCLFLCLILIRCSDFWWRLSLNRIPNVVVSCPIVHARPPRRARLHSCSTCCWLWPDSVSSHCVAGFSAGPSSTSSRPTRCLTCSSWATRKLTRLPLCSMTLENNLTYVERSRLRWTLINHTDGRVRLGLSPIFMFSTFWRCSALFRCFGGNSSRIALLF